jgi:colicin import membrane protein
METAWDKTRAVLFSLLLHGLVVGLLFVGLFWQQLPNAEAAAGPPIEASLVSAPQQAAELAKEIRALERKTAQEQAPPKPEPRPQDVPQPPQPIPQAQIPKPDTVDQDEVRKLAEQAAAQKQLQEQEERRKQGQIDLSRKQEQAQEESRQRQLAALEKERADNARKMMLADQKMKQDQNLTAQLALNNPPRMVAPNAPSRAPAGNNAGNSGLAERYKAAIKEVVHNNWHPQDVPPGIHCSTHYKQLPGGEVFDVTFGACPYDAAARASVEDALKRTPLPYAGFEPVFQREGTIDVCDPEDACR